MKEVEVIELNLDDLELSEEEMKAMEKADKDGGVGKDE